MHIASSKTARSAFTVAGLCAFEAKLENELSCFCCTKLNIKFNDSSRSVIGYVMEERHGRWIISLKDNATMSTRPVSYDNKTGEYSFPEVQNLQKGYFVITQCWPIWILIYTRGQIRFICSGVGLKKTNSFLNYAVNK